MTEYKKENPSLEVIGLAFERNAEPSFAYPKIARFIERFGVDYPVLLAGTIAEAGSRLPQLNHVMAFPTSIIVDKKGQVRKIHTGFTGPGTGAYYEEYVKEFTAFVKELQGE
ncbi:MAG: TlpA family protein disulfide reductase [Leadbetterella sp.]|nr:TlpA family protein disulfide reductase [Leadbetterella sp.]